MRLWRLMVVVLLAAYMCVVPCGAACGHGQKLPPCCKHMARPCCAQEMSAIATQESVGVVAALAQSPAIRVADAPVMATRVVRASELRQFDGRIAESIPRVLRT
jgi:hypothetical protein